MGKPVDGDEVRVGGYNARASLKAARQLLAKQIRLCGAVSHVASEKYFDPKLTHLASKLQALAVGIDSLVEGALGGDESRDPVQHEAVGDRAGGVCGRQRDVLPV